MGNTVGDKVASIKSRFRRNQPTEADLLPEAMSCPHCNEVFAANSSALIFNIHIDACLSNGDVMGSQEMQRQIQSPEEALTSENYFYEKVCCDPSQTQFKWKKTALRGFDNGILNLKPQDVKGLSFQEKAVWLRGHLQRMRVSWTKGSEKISIDRTNVLMTSLQQMGKVNLRKEMKIEFKGDEKVNDAGGLLREWMHMVVKELFSESTGIFALCDTDDITYKLKWDEQLDEQFSAEVLELFGMIIGKALFEKIPMNCYLDRTILRQLTRTNPLTLQDIYGYDKGLYKSWRFILDNQIDKLYLDTYFVLVTEVKGETIAQIELIENGSNTPVTDANKKMYVELCMETLCTQKISRSLGAIRKGIQKIIPEQLMSFLEPFELEMLLYGVPFINVDDWKEGTEYKGKYNEGHKVIKWFWEALKEFDQQMLANLLKFATGSSRTPIMGFMKLQNNRGIQSKFIIESAPFHKANPYPKGHTCFNRLELPEYSSKNILLTYLKAIASNDLDGVFGLD